MGFVRFLSNLVDLGYDWYFMLHSNFCANTILKSQKTAVNELDTLFHLERNKCEISATKYQSYPKSSNSVRTRWFVKVESLTVFFTSHWRVWKWNLSGRHRRNLEVRCRRNLVLRCRRNLVGRCRRNPVGRCRRNPVGRCRRNLEVKGRKNLVVSCKRNVVVRCRRNLVERIF